VTRTRQLQHRAARVDASPGGHRHVKLLGNLKRLTTALARLLEPVEVAGEIIPPPLESLGATPAGRLHLTVRSEFWVEATYGLGKVALPLPPRSRNAVALWLFLHAIDTYARNLKTIGFRALCERLGVGIQSPSTSQRAVDRALDVVNAHLATLDLRALRENDVHLAAGYRFTVPRGHDGRVRIDALDDDAAPVRREPSARQPNKQKPVERPLKRVRMVAPTERVRMVAPTERVRMVTRPEPELAPHESILWSKNEETERLIEYEARKTRDFWFCEALKRRMLGIEPPKQYPRKEIV
jgi:hypothetical protein